MMKTFMLLLHVWNPLGYYDTFVMDLGLTQYDCERAITDWTQAENANVIVSCEVEMQP